MIINLIMNALQSLPDTSHGVSVATAFDEAAGKVVITVRMTAKEWTKYHAAPYRTILYDT